MKKRTGGITAIAVLNIVFAVLGMLGGAALHVMNKDADELDRTADMFEDVSRRQQQDMSAEQREINQAMSSGMAEQMRHHSPEAFRYMFAAGMTGGVLLLISGIGLLGMRRTTGYHASFAAGVALVACGTIAVTKLSFMFWGFPMMGAGYAIVMMLLVQFVFKPALYGQVSPNGSDASRT